MSGDTSQIGGYSEDTSALRNRLAGSRTVPEFTMQAVSRETGVPADTLRSWERRYGFPEPSRTDANYRLYSRCDIEAVAWLRDQTALGQGIREAIGTLREIMRENPDESPQIVSPPPLVPVHSLTESLLKRDMETAHRTWDRLAVATSPDGLCSEVILPAHARVWEDGESIDVATRLSANALLLRKATVLFDQAAPDRGSREAVILTRADASSLVPAVALGAVLSRDGIRFPLPILNIELAESVLALQSVSATAHVILVTPDMDDHAIRGLERMLPDRDVRRWWYGRPDAGDRRWLPFHILAVANALSRPA